MNINRSVISVILGATIGLMVCFIVAESMNHDMNPTPSAISETNDRDIKSYSHEHLTIDGMECVRVDRRSLSCNWNLYKGH